MIDVIAAIAVIAGSLVAALGALGLLRFPDVFTRMHAATKAATVGVIGTTAAAAAEAGAVSGLLVLLVLGIAQVGLAIHVRNTVVACAAEGARLAANADRSPADGAALAPSIRCSAAFCSSTGWRCAFAR